MTSHPISPLCVPDAYLTDERLRVLFNEFNMSLSHAVPRPSIFANLVNSVRQLYVSHILILQQDIISPSTPDRPEFCDMTTAQHDHNLATQHDDLTAQHEKEVAELTERHNEQLREIKCERELERSKWGRYSPGEWIVGIDVVYGNQESEKPPNRIQELTGVGDSINYSLSGKYVWLVPRYSTDPTNALTGVGVSIQEGFDNVKRNIAQGDGGKNRYLVPRSVKDDKKIYCMHLLRLDHRTGGAPTGYDGSTLDINGGRGGGWLYLIWKSQSI